MNLTNFGSDFDKENHNFQNYQPPVFPLKKKIDKKSLINRYKNEKTVLAIRRLTLDLKKKIYKTQNEPDIYLGQLTLKSKEKEEKFPCFSDELAVKEDQGFNKLLKRRLADNDIDS